MINPSKIIANNKAEPGDVLLLTKPIGVGVISFARQMSRASDGAMSAISQSMTQLNRSASEIMQDMGVACATDVTGFGLLGHLSEMVSQSGVTVEIFADRVPVFDEALELIRGGVISGAIERNREYALRFVVVADDVSDEMQHVLYDPQTSGGLLIAVAEEKAKDLLNRLKEKGLENASIIGKALSKSDGKIVVKKSPQSETPKIVETGKAVPVAEASAASCCEEPPDLECCASGPDILEEEPAKTAADAEAPCCESPPEVDEEKAPGHTPESHHGAGGARIKEKFSAFMKEVNAEGAISLQDKELIAIALSLLAKCEPCTKIHIKKAISIGISNEAIDEAVWMAIAFGGAPIMMFYNTIKGQQ
jgi:AhpD family alkylhydroperoxidase